VREIEIHLSSGIGVHEIESAIERAIADCDLRITLRTSLQKYPGCIHWHVKNGRMSGTLEITLWPEKRRAWFTIQDGRKAEWIEAELKVIEGDIRRLTSNGNRKSC
jgi:hypothetical protein